MKKYTNEDFIKRANKIHKNKYRYDKVNYTNNRGKVLIYCPKCDEYFWQIAGTHLAGSGCRKCATKEVHKQQCCTKEDFIIKAKKIHGDKYNYDNIQYISTHTKIKIYCNRCHKYFKQTPSSHLSGCGCAFCSYQDRGQVKAWTKDQFINAALTIHGDTLYNYDEVVYKNMKTKVKIFCCKCEKYFYQTPSDHIFSKKGCPICKNSKGEQCIIKWLKDHQIQFIFQKIFSNCKYHTYLKFDFFIPVYNVCIEYQGKQHYSPDFFINLTKSLEKGQYLFQEQQVRDQIKRDYCENNKIQLIEIKYTDNIEDKLNSVFFNL